MHGLFILALIGTLFVSAVVIFLLRRIDRSAILPMSCIGVVLAILYPVVFLWVRLPLDRLLRTSVDGQLYHALSVLYAPLTEEPTKLWVLLLPMMASMMRDKPAVVATIIGFGFGTGELWLIASLLSSRPELAGMPWYQLTPFLGERLLACCIHAGLACAAMTMLARGHGFLSALIVAMGLHLLVNLPIYLLGPQVLSVPASIASIILTLWVVCCAVLAGIAVILSSLPGQGPLALRLFGMRTCPRCQTTYTPPLVVAINLGTTRIERCPHCRHWSRQPMGHSQQGSTHVS